MVQFEVGLHPSRGNLLAPLGALLLAACGGALALVVLGPLVRRARRRLHASVVRRRRLRAAATAEVRARAMMDELCPYGWRAQIALFGDSDESDSSGTPDRPREWVALDWTAFEDEGSRVTMVRRVRAPTIHEALDAMIADRRTDETLQQIEQSAASDGALWPDP